MFRVLNATTAVVVVVASVLIFGFDVFAHERRMVGPYQFVVGWLNEPAFEGAANAATVRITDPRENPAKAMEGLERSLKIDVIAGGLAPFSGPLRAVFGQPGLYALDMFPTVSGQYRYRVTGMVGTTNVDETFQSGPTTFNDVVATTSLQYPAKVPEGSELLSRLDAIQSGIDQTRVLALVALALAIVGLGGAALARRRSS